MEGVFYGIIRKGERKGGGKKKKRGDWENKTER